MLLFFSTGLLLAYLYTVSTLSGLLCPNFKYIRTYFTYMPKMLLSSFNDTIHSLPE